MSDTRIPTLEHTRNLALFLAILFAVAKRRDRRVMRVAAIGAVGLLLLDSAIVAGEAWQKLPETIPFNRAYEILAVLSVYHATGAAGMFAAPAFIGALAALALNQSPAKSTTPTARNAPCSCGSGRKWKHCCGASPMRR